MLLHDYLNGGVYVRAGGRGGAGREQGGCGARGGGVSSTSESSSPNPSSQRAAAGRLLIPNPPFPLPCLPVPYYCPVPLSSSVLSLSPYYLLTGGQSCHGRAGERTRASISASRSPLSTPMSMRCCAATTAQTKSGQDLVFAESEWGKGGGFERQPLDLHHHPPCQPVHVGPHRARSHCGLDCLPADTACCVRAAHVRAQLRSPFPSF